MRYDHLMKTQDDSIHWANIIFGLCAVFAVVMALLFTLEKNIKEDFTNIEKLVNVRKQNRD